MMALGIVYDLYRPKEANADNKVPFVIVVPGFQRSKEALSKTGEARQHG